jgi:Protein of unknown function (DUF1552)
MSQSGFGKGRSRIHRRNFLQGAAGLTVGLPFLEGLAERSAWAQNEVPVFSLFMVAANGVVPDRFFPGAQGPLNAGSLDGKAVGKLAEYANNLLIVGGLRHPIVGRGCGHSEGLCQTLTGVQPGSSGVSAVSGGQSVDMFISNAVNGQGKDPITMYAGAGNYIKERISFTGPGAARPMQLNPYATFQELVGIVDGGTAPSVPTTPTTPGQPANMVDEILIRRKSVLDTVRTEISELQNLTSVSAADKQRLKLHYDAFREIEIDLINTGDQMGEMAGDDPILSAGCTMGSLDVAGVEAFSGGVRFSQNGNMIEDIVRLHGEVTALAFACNYNRVGVLQWGDGTDGTKYAGLAAGAVSWPFHQVSHRVESDSQVGNNATAEDTHAQIDAIRMETLAKVLKHFSERGLFANSVVYWTNHVANGAHSNMNVPIIIAGSGGGYFKQGQYLQASGENKPLLGAVAEATGAGTGFASPLTSVKA